MLILELAAFLASFWNRACGDTTNKVLNVVYYGNY